MLKDNTDLNETVKLLRKEIVFLKKSAKPVLRSSVSPLLTEPSRDHLKTIEGYKSNNMRSETP